MFDHYLCYLFVRRILNVIIAFQRCLIIKTINSQTVTNSKYTIKLGLTLNESNNLIYPSFNQMCSRTFDRSKSITFSSLSTINRYQFCIHCFHLS